MAPGPIYSLEESRDRLLARLVTLNNAVALSVATLLAAGAIAYREGTPHFAPAKTADLGAMRFVGGATPVLAQKVIYPKVLGAGSATDYGLTWRTVPTPPARQALEDAGIYWAEGGPVNSGGARKRHHLKVRRVSSEGQALRIARRVIDNAGGDSSDLEIVKPSPGAAERIERMSKIIRAASAT